MALPRQAVPLVRVPLVRERCCQCTDETAYQRAMFVCARRQVVKKLTMKKAYEITMETHKAGKATVTQAWKSKVCSIVQ